MGRLDRCYAFLPFWAQNTAVSLYGLYRYWLRFGTGYKGFVDEYAMRENFSREEWEKWQQKELNSLLAIAAEKVPYYKVVWSREEKKNALKGKLFSLPLLEKNHIREHPELFLRQDSRPLYRMIYHTSGSSGTPVATYWTVPEFRKSRALREARSARWAGVSFRIPRATFSGRLVEPRPESKGPFHRYNIFERQVYFSAFHLRPDTAESYVRALHAHGIQWMTGYAVSFWILAKFILEQKLRVPPLKAVVTTSEKLTEEMRKIMTAAYGCPVFEEYSTVETAIFASECREGRLHVSPDAGIVEILKPDGSPCLPGETGEVVTTCLFRRYQPFIRYRLGDLAMWDADPCTCGRSMPVIKEVIGRIEDVVVGEDGRQMVRFHGIFTGLPHVHEGQVIQESLKHIRVKVVPSGGFDGKDVSAIASRVRQRLGQGVEVIVEKVDRIPRTAAGKFKAVISLVEKKDKATDE